ncbi:MAG: hypothetical protein C0501_25645 [Isosphaera sp.]|nr:hypothetical protein [Isosphaera sp.]
MPDWLASRLPDGWTGWHLAAATVAFAVASAVVSLVAVGYVLTRLPADYFVNPAARRPIDRHPVLKLVLVVVRNLFGWFLIALGVLLSLPGVPGQGVLTILMGVMLIDFPGKHRAERWLLTRRGVLAGVNALRARAGRPPLEVQRAEDPSAGSSSAL